MKNEPNNTQIPWGQQRVEGLINQKWTACIFGSSFRGIRNVFFELNYLTHLAINVPHHRYGGWALH